MNAFPLNVCTRYRGFLEYDHTDTLITPITTSAVSLWAFGDRDAHIYISDININMHGLTPSPALLPWWGIMLEDIM